MKTYMRRVHQDYTTYSTLQETSYGLVKVGDSTDPRNKRTVTWWEVDDEGLVTPAENSAKLEAEFQAQFYESEIK